MATNVAIALAVAAMIQFVGAGPFLLVHLPIVLLQPLLGSGFSTSIRSSKM